MVGRDLSRRGLMALGAASLWAGASCSEADGPIPKIVARLGQTADEIVARSMLGRLPAPNIDPTHGSAWGLDRPHQFLYDDGRLQLLFPTCGFDLSMPSMFVFDDTNRVSFGSGQRLIRASVSVFGEYVPVGQAMAKAHTILDDVARQVGAAPVEGFLAEAKGEPDRGELPALVGPEVFLDQRALATEITLQRTVGPNNIDLRIRNMNRKYSDLPPDTLVEQERARSREALMAEAVYYIDFYIYAPFPS